MTAKQTESLQGAGAWITRILLGVAAFFLVKASNKLDKVVQELHQVVVVQSRLQELQKQNQLLIGTVRKEVDDLRVDVRQELVLLREKDEEFDEGIKRFYEKYGPILK